MLLRPNILLAPTLSPPLNTLSPKELLGDKWWTEQRKQACSLSADCCWTCGVHKDKSWYRKYLEGHELYKIDYENFIIELLEVVVLCHSCHNFIHIGRLISNYRDGIIKESYLSDVLNWGVRTLSNAGLAPYSKQALYWLIFQREYTFEDALTYVKSKGLIEERTIIDPNWTDWKMIINNQEYPYDTNIDWDFTYDSILI